MRKSSITLTEELNAYLVDATLRDDPILAELREETAGMRWGGMQIAPEQGQFMALLIKLIDARRVLEVGTFTGYSALVMAKAMAEDGRLIACDVSEDYTAVARRYWQRAGVAHKIDLRLAPAVETLDRLLAEGGAGSFDFMFIDADKEGYDAYYERGLKLLRAGGLMAIDNVLWDGAVIDPSRDDSDTRAIRSLNEKVRNDSRIFPAMLPIADGLTLIWKPTAS
jgi:predicted O-methyltransferase YrrM